MRDVLRIITIASLPLFAASCGSNNNTAPAEQHEQPQLSTKATPSNASVSSSGGGATSNAPVPPKDARYTILAAVINGQDHVAQANQIKSQLAASSGLKAWYVVHEEGRSMLYHGYYRSVRDPQDPKEAARAQADLRSIQSMTDAVGNPLFRTAIPVPIDSPDPTAPPEWNLANARGAYSLQIAAYEGAGRKEAAVDAVRSARASGVEAYYHHGPNVSEVCIGAWPASAVKVPEADAAKTPEADQERTMVVAGPGAELAARHANGMIDPVTKLPLKVVNEKVQVLDPSLAATIERYPHHVVNGMEEITEYRDPRTGKTAQEYKPSMIVPIPTSETADANSGAAPGNQPNLLWNQSRATPATPGSSRLRSVGQ